MRSFHYPFLRRTRNHILRRTKEAFIYIYIYIWEMLTNAFRALINNPFKESFYRKKKAIYVLAIFFFFIKVML